MAFDDGGEDLDGGREKMMMTTDLEFLIVAEVGHKDCLLGISKGKEKLRDLEGQSTRKVGHPLDGFRRTTRGDEEEELDPWGREGDAVELVRGIEEEESLS